MRLVRLIVVLCLGAGCVDLGRPPARDPQVVDMSDGGGVGGSDAKPDRPDSPVVGSDDGPAPQPEVAGSDAGDAAETGGPHPLANGRPCARDEQCGSGFCAQGFCCDGGCTEACRTCNLPGFEGQCVPVPAGQDSKESCAQEASSTCGRDGTCDGAGACRRYPANAECAPGGCSDGVERGASTCDGAGVCRPGTTTACASGVCSGNTCGAPCSPSVACQPGFYCSAGRCALKRTAASTCASDDECASGFCTDGVCCGSRCGESCFACNVTGSVGTCKPVPNGQDPRAVCPAEAQGTCGRAGGCNGSGACRLWPASTVCVAGSCSGVTETAARTCDGLGSSQAASSQSCIPYACNGATCATSCSGASGCASGYSCVGAVCISSNLILFWRFEETSGTTANDSSGNGRSGTYIGETGTPAPSTVLPPLQYTNGSSRAFTMANRHAVTLNPMPAAVKPASELTIAAWYRATEVDLSLGGSSYPIGSEVISGANAYVLRLRANLNNTAVTKIELAKRTGNSSFVGVMGDAPAYLDGNWHHVAATISKTSGMHVYFDGVDVGASTDVADIFYTQSATGFYVGRHGDGQTQFDFGGNIDEVRVYDRALSGAEIATLAAGKNN